MTRGRGVAALAVVSAAALCAATYAVAGADRSASKAASGSISIAIGGEPSTLDPLVRDDGNERAVTQNIFETLMGRTPDGKKLYPKLAKAFPKRVNPTTWRFTLRSGIKFTDGEPLDADAVVASVKHILDPKVNSEQVGYIGSLKGAKKVNAQTVDILTKGTDPILPSRMYWLRIIPANWKSLPDFASKPVGTGPYKLSEWARGDHITLTANPSYWGSPKPSIETVTYKFVPEESTQLAGLAAGNFDLITNLIPEDAKRAPKAVAVTSTEHPIFILNARPGSQVTANVKVRQALNYAVDKNAIAQKLFLGYATVDHGQLLSSTMFGYDKATKAYPYSVAKAKQLIQQAGATGKTLNVVGESGRWLKDRELIESAAQFWRSIGLKVNVKFYAFPQYLNRLFDTKHRPDVVFVSSSNELYDADRTFTTYYEPSGIGASNSDKQMQKWVDDARTELNTSKRTALYHKAVRRARQQAYFVWLVNYEGLWGMSKNLQWQPRNDGFIFVNTMRLT
ncbi:MAG TPA: ABC transporter substrate-binding protein [Gaiellaceae bacterium]|jgi:peptide/nickel transport system substrate-binding protein|nr:ABC transporter substrate-binding protein [Gaiellaceae bacterium]